MFIPLSIGVGLIWRRRKLDYMSVSCLCLFLLFVVLYVSLVLPYTEKYYDGSHGSSETVFSNFIKELLYQKLLIIMFLVFVYRLFVVLIKKRNYDEFSDSLLLAGAVVAMGCFALRLHGVYYLAPLILSTPAMLCTLSLDRFRDRMLSYSALLLIVGYFFRKNSEKVSGNVLEEGNLENDWLYGHLVANLAYLKRDRSYVLTPLEKLKGGMVSLSPETTDITILKEQFPSLYFNEEGTFVDLRMYRVE